MDIVSRIYLRDTFIVKGMSHLLFAEKVRLGVHGFLTFIMGSRRIENNIFPLIAGKALTFCRCHSVTADWNKWVKILEEGNTVNEGERKRHLCAKRRK